ncbi:HlyD family secretion protein [Pelagibacterium lacus]|uniref:HlyD family efflux transporter periplasmic adaptor subunit n=1 Tax=Pelagibacterium lacus TaxID=2282655 RepID=A0A369VZ23_9HYPH|nr:HlyD family efflux transporter periplasmic adaptor subunit [Pelagibacterium lacus]RDE07646.1 HlyD family efflux transporter periplasmic adaptor subunit [Pelagibacterium lacus]
MSLFRPESLEAKRHAWLGRPIVLSSLSTRVFAWFSILFVIAAILFVSLGSYTRRVEVAGIVMPVAGITRMTAPQGGWVIDIAVADGDEVRRGDVLYRIGVDITTALGNTQDAISDILNAKRDELQAALERQSALDAAEKQRLEQQIETLEYQLPQIEEQIALSVDFTEQLRAFADRQLDLLDKGISVSGEVEGRLQAYHAERTRLPLLEREKAELAGELSQLRTQLANFDLASADRIGQLHQQVLDVEQQISEGEARRQITITAPREGVVTAISTLAGQTVTAGSPLLTIVPTEQPLVAQLIVPSSAIGFLREGGDVLLRYQAFPYQKFGQYRAEIAEISRATLRPEEVAQIGGMGMGDAGFYRVVAQPELAFVNAYGHQEPLQAGMEVSAHLLVDTRPLYQWILEPLYGLRGGVATAAEL